MIPERRVYDGQAVVFDARDLLKHKPKKDEVLLKMLKPYGTYDSSEGVRFYAKHPFQYVTKTDADQLLGTGDFNLASIEEAEDHYSF